MSIRWMNDVWEHSPYKGVERLIHLALADNANEHGECYPHLPTIIRKARTSRTAAYRCLRKMRDDGLLSYEGVDISKPSREIPLILQRVPEWDCPVPNRDASVPSWDSTADRTSHIRTLKEPSSNRVTDVTPVTSTFDEWWKIYPKRVGKGAARLAFAKALKKTDALRLLEAAEQYAASRISADKQFTLNPATWLNQERWDDEMTTLESSLPDADTSWYDELQARRAKKEAEEIL